jgi:hypothetical protein
MSHYRARQKSTNFSEEPVSSIFRKAEESKQEMFWEGTTQKTVNFIVTDMRTSNLM